jgi:hypothetical protein
MSRLVLRFGCILFLAWVVVGCSKKATYVTGEVNYEGSPVQSGYISFIPVDGQGASTGGPIVRGKFKVEDVPPGPKRVEIRAGAELAAMPDIDAKAPAGKAGQPKGEEEMIPADAEGNNVTVEIGKGNQKLQPFNLERPIRKKAEPPKK